MPYPDLQTMFNNGMGGFAAVQAGQQASDSQVQQQQQSAAAAQQAQMQQALLQKQQLENQQSQVMNPLDAMFKQGQVDQQQAQLPGIQANSSMLQGQAYMQQATQASQIAASISKASAQIGDDGMKKMAQDAERTTQMASLLRTIPVIQRQAALQDAMVKYGGDPDSPFAKSFMQVPPDKLPDTMDQVAKGMALASQSYQEKKALADSKNAADLEQAKVHAGATVQAAQIGSESRIQLATMANQARANLMANKPKNMDQAITALSAIPASERTAAEQAQLDQISQERRIERAAGAPSLPAQMTGQSTPMANAAAANPFAQPTAQPQIPQGPAPLPGMKQVGTSGGKPVYENAQGQRFIGN